jgi:predicted MFS family arabinose efflux permease
VTLVALAAVVTYSGGPPLVVYVLYALVSAAGTAFRPAQAALLPALATTPEDLTAANAVATTIESAASFVGPAIGGILIAVTQPGTAFLVAAATFGWSAAMLIGIREPPRELAGQGERMSVRSVGGHLADGVRALTEDRRVTLLVGLLSVQVVVYGALLVYMTGLSFNVLGGGEKQYGILVSALGVGGVIGAAGSFGLIGSNLVRSFAVSFSIWGAPIALLAVWQTRSGAFVLVALTGLANTLLDVSALTLLQRAVPVQVLGRVFGIFESITYGAVIIGAVGAPFLVEAAGLNAALVATGVLMPVLIVLCWPALRRLEDVAAAPKERIDLLRRVPFLVLLPEPAIGQLADALVPVHAEAGEQLIRQGDVGDRFYIVEQGGVAVAVDGREVQRGGPGYYFGEIALLRNEPRTASVSAVGDTELLALERDDFLATVTGHADSAKEAHAIVSSRLGIARPALFSL